MRGEKGGHKLAKQSKWLFFPNSTKTCFKFLSFLLLLLLSNNKALQCSAGQNSKLKKTKNPRLSLSLYYSLSLSSMAAEKINKKTITRSNPPPFTILMRLSHCLWHFLSLSTYIQPQKPTSFTFLCSLGFRAHSPLYLKPHYLSFSLIPRTLSFALLCLA